MRTLSSLRLYILIIVFFLSFSVKAQVNYLDYHREIVECEELIVEGSYEQAIIKFDSLFQRYDFVFLRDYKLATEISAYSGHEEYAFKFLRAGVLGGWEFKSINKSKTLDPLKSSSQWAVFMEQYDSLNNFYLLRINKSLQDQVNEMFKKDQKKALGALFRIGNKAQERYGDNKFAPHSEQQLDELEEILEEYGYPGELLIGNNWWMSTVLSHHNSISKNYVLQDTIYQSLRPKLLDAIENGELSPYEFALIEDWRTAVINEHGLTSYGFVGGIPDEKVVSDIDSNRALIGLRSLELRNSLVDKETELGINFYLPGGNWQEGKIEFVK